MKKEALLPLVSAGLLAPLFLSTGVAADEVSAEQPAEAVSQVESPAAEPAFAPAASLAAQPPVVEVPETAAVEVAEAQAQAEPKDVTARE